MVNKILRICCEHCLFFNFKSVCILVHWSSWEVSSSNWKSKVWIYWILCCHTIIQLSRNTIITVEILKILCDWFRRFANLNLLDDIRKLVDSRIPYSKENHYTRCDSKTSVMQTIYVFDITMRRNSQCWRIQY